MQRIPSLVTIKIPDEIYEELETYAVKSDKPISQLCEELIKFGWMTHNAPSLGRSEWEKSQDVPAAQ
jgi:predicted CopG family antitoxin|tara:strand:+ start:2704 stop:2904 length:201 start_codon:yes stop_codon:yes gene_type:complete